jgi:hypothetical protein
MTLAGLLVLSVCPSCVEREENLTVGLDGAVAMEVQIKGSEEEITQGDALPSEASGWTVRRSREEDKEVLESRRSFGPGEALPFSFAAPDDPDADLYLEFPTTVRVEHRPDAVYYYFGRTYEPRRWAYVERWKEFLLDSEFEQLSEKPVEELTFEEQCEIAEAFAAMEAVKQLEFAQEALAESHPDLPREYGLMARRALINVYIQDGQGDAIQEVIRSCGDLPDEQRGDCFDRAANGLLDEAYSAYVQTLEQNAAFTPRDVAAFADGYRRAARGYAITEQLGGHNFDISVTMPGTIIAHSGLDDDVDVDEEAHTSTVEFEFDGRWFRDNPYELVAVSRLDHETLQKMRDRIDGSDR